jgi:hypothetical protein
MLSNGVHAEPTESVYSIVYSRRANNFDARLE